MARRAMLRRPSLRTRRHVCAMRAAATWRASASDERERVCGRGRGRGRPWPRRLTAAWPLAEITRSGGAKDSLMRCAPCVPMRQLTPTRGWRWLQSADRISQRRRGRQTGGQSEWSDGNEVRYCAALCTPPAHSIGVQSAHCTCTADCTAMAISSRTDFAQSNRMVRCALLCTAPRVQLAYADTPSTVSAHHTASRCANRRLQLTAQRVAASKKNGTAVG
jgi:hypothetical protein